MVLSLLFSFLWNSAFSVSKIAVLNCPPFYLVSIRFLLASIVLIFPLIVLRRFKLHSFQELLIIFIIGFLGNTLYLGPTIFALKTVPSNIVAIIASLNPILSSFISSILFQEKLSKEKKIGIAFGALGIVIILFYRICMQGMNSDIVGLALVLFGLFAFIASNFIFKFSKIKTDIYVVNSLQVLVGALTLFPLALNFENYRDINFNSSFILSTSYLALIVSGLCTTLWFYLLKKRSIVEMSSFFFLNPVFGIFFGKVLLNENLSITEGVAIFFIVLAIYFVNKREVKKQ